MAEEPTPQEATVTETVTATTHTGVNPMVVKPSHIMLVALITIIAWIGFSAWILYHGASEAERAQILKMAETLATAGVFYYLGSSAGSRNKEHR